MKKTLIALAVAGSMALAPMASADNLSYSYAQVSADYWVFDDFSNEWGYGLRGSAAISDDFYLHGDFNSVDIGPADAHAWSAGFGYRVGLNDTTDLYAEVGYARARARVSGFGSISDNGYRIQVGTRFLASSTFEGRAGVDYVNLDGGDTSLVLEGIYKANQNIGLVAGVNTDFDDHKLNLGVRFNF